MSDSSGVPVSLPASWRLSNIDAEPSKEIPVEYAIAGLFPPPVDSEFEGLYYPFVESPLWQVQRDYFSDVGSVAWQHGQVPHYITQTPVLVDAWAETTVRYWFDGVIGGKIDPEKPLYALEIGAGCGRFSIQFVNRLEEKLEQLGLEDLDWCVLVSDVSATNREFIAAHPYLESNLESGRVKVIPFNAESDTPLAGQIGSDESDTLENPLVVISNYVFDSLKHDLVYLHYGDVYQAHVALETQTESGFESSALHYRWQKKETAEFGWTDFINQQVAGYASRLECGPVFIPIGTLDCLGALHKQSPAGLLLLTADRGDLQLDDLRRRKGGGLVTHGSISLPVNFHCLQNWLENENAECYFTQHRRGGLVLGGAILDKVSPEGQTSQYRATKQSIMGHLSGFNPDDFFMVKKSLEELVQPNKKSMPTESQMLAYLRLSLYDPQVLALMLEQLHSEGVAIERRLEWCDVSNGAKLIH